MPKQGRGQGQGTQTCRGTGQSRGLGSGMGGGQGRGQGGGQMGGGGFCLCLKCGHRSPHSAGSPCLQERCPSCGSAMVREGSPHHQEIKSRRSINEPTS